MRKLSVILITLLISAPPLSTPSAAGDAPASPRKPPELDDHGWVSLQDAYAKASRQQAKLMIGAEPGADGDENDSFGVAVAIDGDTALIGASRDQFGRKQFQGSAYVFVRMGSGWVQQAKLTADDGAAFDVFGSSVALAGDTALVGAPGVEVGSNQEQGAAYVFVRSGSSWLQQAKITAKDGGFGDYFGGSVDLEDGTALIGAESDHVGVNARQGSAYVFYRAGSVWTQHSKLTADDGQAVDYFGGSVALSGDTALIGASGDDIGANVDQGSAYIFVLTNGNWVKQAKLTATDGAPEDGIGLSVALDEDLAVVAGFDQLNGVHRGAAFVFARIGVSWVERARLVPSGGAWPRNFGASAAISGGTALVGAFREDISSNFRQGVVYVFTSSSGWSQQARLMAADGATNDEFGVSVALEGDSVLIGAHLDNVGENSNQGSVYEFSRSSSGWTQQSHLTSGFGAGGDVFGASVALSDDTALVSAPGDTVGDTGQQGSVYVFLRNLDSWTLQAHLTASDGAAKDWFGSSISLSGDTALIGAPGDDVGANADQGSAYIFTREDTVWTQRAHLTSDDPAPSDLFGSAVALDGSTAVIGAPGSEVWPETDQGLAYAFFFDGESWIQQGNFYTEDGERFDNFGSAVDVNGDTAVVGAWGDNVGSNQDQGSVHLFTRMGSYWISQGKLVADDGGAQNWFGSAVALDGDVMLIGSPGVDVEGMSDRGSVYAFNRQGQTWSATARLTPIGSGRAGRFGTAIALQGDQALIGAPRASFDLLTVTGGAYAYTLRSGTWTQSSVLIANDGAVDDEFGAAVAMFEDTAVVGARFVVGSPPFGNAYEGAAYVFGLCRVDCLFADSFE